MRNSCNRDRPGDLLYAIAPGTLKSISVPVPTPFQISRVAVTGLDPFGGYLSGTSGVQRPNLVSGVPLWISNPNVAAGKEINPTAFMIPTGAVQGDLGRNALRGFGATEVDLTLRRQFKLRERLSLQARADLFNIFNHPNFGGPINYLSSPQFGQSTQMLGTSLGSGGQSGGLNPLYQIGGPRSVQFAMKLLF